MHGKFSKALGGALLVAMSFSGDVQAKVPEVAGDYDVTWTNSQPACLEHWHLHRDGSFARTTPQPMPDANIPFYLNSLGVPVLTTAPTPLPDGSPIRSVLPVFVTKVKP